MTPPVPSETHSASPGAASKPRIAVEFFLAALVSTGWCYLTRTPMVFRYSEIVQDPVAQRLPGEIMLWLVATTLWLDLARRVKSRLVLIAAIVLFLLMGATVVGHGWFVLHE